MPFFDTWREENGETREDARRVQAYDAKGAAEEISRMKFADWDYPSFIDDLCVSEVGDERVHRFEVAIEAVPEFTATRKPGGSAK